MYKQFFGNFLITRNVVTPQQLAGAIGRESSSSISLGTRALYRNLMSASEVDDMNSAQNEEDKPLHALAVERNYLTQQQAEQLLAEQVPEYLLLGQILVEDGIITNSEFENLIIDYETEYEIYDLDLQVDQKVQINDLIRYYFKDKNIENSVLYEEYLILLFNNMIHFIGEDFTPLAPVCCGEYASQYSVVQQIEGKYRISTAIDMDRSAAAAFASRYASEDFQEFDEYVKSSLEDFLNLHNGLFTVNMSNIHAVELHLTPPEAHENDLLEFGPDAAAYLFPILYPFGTVSFVFSC